MPLRSNALRVAKKVEEEQREKSEDDRRGPPLEEQRHRGDDDRRDDEEPPLRSEADFWHSSMLCKGGSAGKVKFQISNFK
ncbi:MAG: hypothetical protein DMF58_07125 [Acidobacteria bacterium]|nr:MAG: hypothetical protein DMF58_07125 [Acidobacteriota bacterium]